MNELERRLEDLGERVVHPDTPALAQAVEERLAREPALRQPRIRRSLAIALAVVLVPTAVAGAVTPVRHAVLELLGIRGVEVRRAPKLQWLQQLPPQAKRPLGTRMTLERAAGLADFPLVTPRITGLGAPLAVYFRSIPAGGTVAIVYGRSLTLTEFSGRTEEPFLRKTVGPGTRVEPVKVDGQPGAWLVGQPHEVAYLDAQGRVRTDTLRLAGNTLVWQRGPLTLRLEGGALSKSDALRIAGSVR